MEKKIEWLDSLRGIACLIVVVAHIVAQHPVIGMYANGCGKIGVWLFLVMSSFLLLYHTGSKVFSGKNLIRYYWNKMLRLYPVYIIGLILAYFSGLLPEWTDILKHLFLLEGYGHFWYMPVIIKFFMIAPVFKWLYTKFSKKVFSCIISGLLVVLAVCFPFTEYTENSIELRWYMPVFLMGMLLYMLYEKMKDYKQHKIWDAVAIVAVGIILLLTPWMREKLWRIDPANYLQNKYILIGGLWCIIMIAVSRGIQIRKVLEKSRFLQEIGKISYAIYIFHYIILLCLKEKGVAWGVNGILTFCFSIVISIGVRRWIEQPIERRKVMRKNV